MTCHPSFPSFTPLWPPPSSARPSRTMTAMWPHINHTGFWLINFDNPNLHCESYDLHLWIVLSARVQNGPPPLRDECEMVLTNRGLSSHRPSLARRARSATESVSQNSIGTLTCHRQGPWCIALDSPKREFGEPLVHEDLALLQRAVW